MISIPKILIQIPCFNEETVIGDTLEEIKKHIKNYQNIEILIIDDGSNDSTVKIAKENNVNHIISHPKNVGLGLAWNQGLNFAKK